MGDQTGIITTLGLNGWLFLAQLVNFGLIVFVLWRWVWGPLMRTLDARQATIAKGLADAERAARQVKEAAERERATLAAAEKTAQAMIEEARAKAEAERRDIMRETQASLDAQLAEARERLKQEREAVLASVRREVAGLVQIATERVIGETLQSKHHQTLIEEAIAGLKDVSKL